MITDAIVNALAAFFSLLGDMIVALFPPVPAWASSASEKVSQIVGVMYSLDSWVPVGLLMTVAGAVLAAYAVALVIGVIRLVASYLTLGGGAT